MDRSYYVLFFSLVLDLLAFTIILPLLPSILDYYGNKNSDDRSYTLLLRMTHLLRNLVDIPDTTRMNSVLFGGILGSMFSMLQFISSPILGALSDVYGRKPMLLLTAAGTGLSYIVWAFSSSFSTFLLARIIGGLSKGNIGIAMAFISDTSDEKSRGKGMAMVGIAFSLGFLLGPSLGAYFSLRMRSDPIGFFRIPALVSFSLLLAGMILIALFLPESLPVSKRAKYTLKHVKEESLHLINPLSLLRFSTFRSTPKETHEQMVSIGCVQFLYLFIYSGLEFTLTFLVHLRFSYSSVDQGKMFIYIGTLMILLQGGYVRRIPPEKMKKAVSQALFCLVPGFVIIGMATSGPLLYFGLALFAFASAVVVSLLTTMVSLCGSTVNQGQLLGVFRSIGAFARATGPVFASAAFWILGPTKAYILGAILMTLPIFVFHKMVK